MALGDDASAQELYARELRYLEDLTREYARDFPRAGQRLAGGASDPHVARLLEGVAVLTSGLRAHQQRQFEEFVRSLAEALCPRLVSPVPSLGIVRVEGNRDHFDALADGTASIARGARLQDHAGRTFTATKELRITPFALEKATFEIKPERWSNCSAALVLRLDAGGPVSAVKPDGLAIHLGGPNSALLYEWMAARATEVQFFGVAERGAVFPIASGGRVAKVDASPCDAGWGRGDSAPYDGHRLMLEYLALPGRFSFVEISGFARMRSALEEHDRSRKVQTQAVEVVVLFDRAPQASFVKLEDEDLVLNALPVVNLFPRRMELLSAPDRSEHEVVFDANQPDEFEVHSLLEVRADGKRIEQVRSPRADVKGACSFSVRRQTRLERGQDRGTNLLLSLCDEQGWPMPNAEIRVDALVMNRRISDDGGSLDRGRAGGGRGPLRLVDAKVPARSIEWVVGPTEPRMNLWSGDAAHAALALLTTSLGALLRDRGEALTRALEALIHPRFADDRALLHDAIGNVSSSSQPRGFREPDGRRSVLRATVVELEVAGGTLSAIGGAVLFSAIFQRFLADATPINSVVEVVLKRAGDKKGTQEVRWPPMARTRVLA